MELKELREQINRINHQMLDLFSQRMEVSAGIARYKAAHGLPILDEAREAEILQNVAAGANENYRFETVEMFRTLMNLSKMYQLNIVTADSPMQPDAAYPPVLPNAKQVVFYGAEGSYTWEAMKSCFGDISALPAATFRDVFETLKQGKADYGIVPIENSSTGSIFDSYELFCEYGYHIVGETNLRISHNLMGLPGAKTADLTEIYSHPQPFMQCENFLSSLDVKLTPYYNTAASAKMVAASGDKTRGVIGSASSAAFYGLEILQSEIEDNPNNYTRFAIVSKDLLICPGASKVSIAFSLSNESGSLYHTLSVFAKHNLNLIKLESRPYPASKWKYLFYADFEGHLSESRIAQTISLLQAQTQDFFLLGNYTGVSPASKGELS